MCGRNSLFPPASTLEDRFDADLHFESYRPRYNIAPGEELAVITDERPDVISDLQWGLRPVWMDADDEGFINARAETAAEKPSFREAWHERPCLVLTSGFYEWQERQGGPNQPYRIHRPEDPAFAFAGLWEPGHDGNGEQPSVTILTTAPNDLISPIHDRMPVILPMGAEWEWVTADPDRRADLCRPYPEDDIDAYPISRQVNNPGNDDPSIIEPIDDPQTGLGEFA